MPDSSVRQAPQDSNAIRKHYENAAHILAHSNVPLGETEHSLLAPVLNGTQTLEENRAMLEAMLKECGA